MTILSQIWAKNKLKLILSVLWQQLGFGCRGGALAAGRLGRGCRCLGLRGAFSEFYRRHSALLEKYSVYLRALLQQGISEPEFCGGLMCRFGGIVGESDFSEQFGGLVDRYGGIGYSLDIMRQTACLVVGPIIVGGCASLFGCAAAVWASGSVTASSWSFGRWVGAWRCVFGLACRGSTVGFHLLWHAVELAMCACPRLLW